MTVGGVLDQALGLYQRFFARFVAVAAIVFVVLDLLSAVADAGSGNSTGAAILWSLVSLVVSIVGVFWVQGALVEAVHDVRDGRIDTTIGELFSRTRPRLPALIAAGVLAGLGVVVGLILLIVPGLYLLTRWALITPVIVLEQRGAGESFGRSWDLVKGHGWKVFGVVVVTLLIALVASLVLGGILGAILPRFLGVWIGGVIVHSLVVPFLALAWTVMYFELARPEPAAHA